MKKLPNRLMAKRSISTCSVDGSASKASVGKGCEGAEAGEANARSRPNAVSPIDPKGTRPISTCLADRRSQSSEPRPIPSVKTPSSRVTLDSLPPSTFFA